MKPPKVLTRKMCDYLELEMANPQMSKREAAKILGITPQTLTCWYKCEPFLTERKRRLDEQWSGLRLKAQDCMEMLIDSGEYRAAAYVLDSLGMRENKVKVDANVNAKVDTINITIGGDDNQ